MMAKLHLLLEKKIMTLQMAAQVLGGAARASGDGQHQTTSHDCICMKSKFAPILYSGAVSGVLIVEILI